jgi:hypothetical protein
VVTQPRNGTVTVDPITGDITYTANSGFYGVDTLTYTVCDSTANPVKCATSIQVITILPKGSPNSIDPIDDYKVIPMNTVASGNVSGNDNDPEGDDIQITAQNITVPGKGTLVLNTDGSYSFTPLTNYSGTVEVPYDACDNATPQACAKATLYITITPQGAPLYVLLNEFSGHERKCMVELNWSTLQETNTARFDIERKVDQTFTFIGSVTAKGNTNSLSNYNFLDEHAQQGNNEYRLKMVDVDGKYSYSGIASVAITCTDPEISIVPNPFADQITVLLPMGSELCTIKLFDVSGRVIYNQLIDMATSTREVVVSTDQLAAGTYYLYVNVDGVERKEKMIKK